MRIFENSIPTSKPADIVEWADTSGIQVDGHSFDSTLNPQGIKPMRAMADAETRVGTYVKPVQSGGSTAGEVVVAYWCRFCNGSVQENWQDDLKAKERWKDRILPSLESIDMKWAGGRDSLICEARFVNATLRAQGVFSETALNSDTIVYQKNEEVHLWKPGHLAMARDRQTRVWNRKALDISNASTEGDQLHIAFEDGTMEEWENFCPKCGVRHAMRFRYNPSKPELGGLRWDSTGCKLDGGKFDYKKLATTLRYEFPCCGHIVRNIAAERRQLRGDYSEPRNTGADGSHKSWISDAVSYDQIEWLMLVKEWHSAIRALKAGDTAPMFKFRTRRECRFWNEDALPFRGQIVVNTSVKMDREGLPNRLCRLGGGDWQQGYKSLGELTHYWVVIEDVLPNCSSQIVFEGIIATDEELVNTLDDFKVPRHAFRVDASKNTKAILSLCYREGLSAVSGIKSHTGSFRHADGTRRFYSEPKAIANELNMPLKFDPVHVRGDDGKVKLEFDPREPVVVYYNKAGLLANHFFIRDMKANVLRNNPQATADDYIERVIPGDVSEEFKQHNESWERVQNRQQKTNDDVEGFRKVRRADHMLMCLGYIDLQKDESGLLGDRLAQLGIRKELK
jgi:hypothetical protein